MSVLAPATFQNAAPRPVTQKTLQTLLASLRPAKYEFVQYRLEGLTKHVQILELWTNVFPGDAPETNSTWTLQCEFAGKVYRDLFPADLDYMDSQVNDGEDPFEYPIVLDGIGIPWEVSDLPDLDTLAILGIVCFMQYLDGSYMEDRENWLSNLDDWESDHLSEYKTPVFPYAVDALKAELVKLPDPLCYLGTLIDTLRKDTGNIFLDLPNAWWQFEYLDVEFCYAWTAEDVLSLGEMFKPIAHRYYGLRKLYDWTENTHGAIGEIVAALQPLTIQHMEPHL